MEKSLDEMKHEIEQAHFLAFVKDTTNELNKARDIAEFIDMLNWAISKSKSL